MPCALALGSTAASAQALISRSVTVLTVPAAQPYSYAWLGGRAYLVEPASGTVVADVTE